MRFVRRRSKSTGPHEPTLTSAPLEGLEDRLRPFVAVPATLPPAAVAGAPEVLPGLVAAVAMLDGEQLDFLPRAAMGPLGGEDAVRERARENMRRLPAPRAEAARATPEDPSSTFFTLVTEDVFGASRVAVLPDLIGGIAGPQRPSHGVLVAVPRWHLVLLHILRGPGTLTALKTMAQVASAEAESVPERGRVSPDVFFVASDWRSQTVAFETEHGISLDTQGLLGEALFGPGGVLASPG